MNTTFTNYAEKKAKQILNLLQGYTKGIRITAILILLLMGVSNAWAGKGFFTDGQWNIKYYDGSSFDKWGNQSGFSNASTCDLGIQTNLYLKGCWVQTWSNDGWTQSKVTWYWGWESGSKANNYVVSKDNVQGNQMWENFNVDYNLISNAPNNPGHNTLYMFWNLDDWNEGNSGNSKITFTIPGFTTTSKSQTFDNTTVGNNSSKTISFGTHYGTALQISDCSFSGTNASEFSVTSINESGVTVKFTPTSAGSKTATLTITDAHGKTCTITLSGDAQSPTPTITISTTQQYLQIGEDKLELTINYTNIPEGHCYRVKVGDGYYNGNANGENTDHVSISGSGSVAFTTYSTLPGGTQPIVVELWTSNPFGATSTKSNTINVTVEQGYEVSIYKQVGSTQTPLGVTISPTEHIGKTATASALAGYTFTGWTSNTANITFKDASALSTLVYAKSGGNIYANYTRVETYAFIQGRFRVNSASRNQMTYTYNDGGQWKEDGTNIQMEYDDTNSRFYLHTYMKPKELTENHGTGCQDCKPYFYIKTSTSSSSFVNTISYQSTTSQTLTTAGTSGKKELATSGGSNANLRFNTQDESGYVILYFDQQYIWYELEHKLEYDANGGTGSAPSRTYHLKGSTTTTASDNIFTRDGYDFQGWNTKADGTGNQYEAEANITIEANTTLYAQWAKPTFTVTLDPQGGTDGTTSVEATYGEEMPEATMPQREGFTFGGYFTETNGGGTQYYNADGSSTRSWDIKEPKTLYAKWIQQYVIVGNGKGSWLNGANWIESVIADASFNVTKQLNNIIDGSVTYSACPAGLKNFRIVPWGTWGTNHGKEQLTSCNVPSYTNEDNNIAFVTVAEADITIGFDGTNITVQVDYDAEDLAAVKAEVVADTKRMFYFGDEWITNNVQEDSYRYHKYVNEYETTTHLVTETKGFKTNVGGTDKYLAVAMLPAAQYSISNRYDWNGVSTGEVVQAGAIYAWYGNQVMGKTAGTSPTLGDVSIRVGTANSGLTASAGGSSIGRAQIITDYYYQKEGESTWTKFDPNNVSALPVGIYTVHALAYDGNIYVRTVEPAILTIYDEYTITYKDQNNATFSGAHEDGYPAIHLYGQTTELKSATKTGYTFGGWFTNQDCTGEPITTLGATDYTAAITLYAKWTAITYTVTLDQTDAKVVGTTSVDAIYDAAMPHIETLPTPKDGYDFAGYYDQKDGAGTQYYDAEGASAHVWDKANDGTLYAKWEATTYTITYHLNGGSGAENRTYTIESEDIILPTPTKAGHTFDGWYDNEDCTGEAITEIAQGSTGDKEYWAKWTINSYTIHFGTEDGGTVSATVVGGNAISSGTSLTYGTQVQLTATPEPGYSFSKWTNGSGNEVSTSNPYTVTIDGNITLNAVFIETTTLYLKPNADWLKDGARFAAYAFGGGEATWYDMEEVGCSGIYSRAIPGGYNNVLFGRMNPDKTENNFDNEVRWEQTIDLSIPTDGTNLFTVTNKSEGSHWNGEWESEPFNPLAYTITLEGEGGTIEITHEGGTATENTTVAPNTIITVALYPHSGYAVGTPKIKIGSNAAVNLVVGEEYTICGPTTITANWVETKYTVAVKSNNNNYGTVNPSSVQVGQYTPSQKITATPKAGYRFVNWTATEGVSINSPIFESTTITASQAGTLTANFEKDPTVYLKPSAVWKSDNARFAVYWWADGNKNGWIDMTTVGCNDEYYTAELPAGVTNFKFVRLKPNGGHAFSDAWNQTIDLTLQDDGKNLFAMKKLHLNIGTWNQDNKECYAAHFYNSSNESKTINLTKGDDPMVYYCDIPTDKEYTNVVFYRVNPSNTGEIWHQTNDLTIDGDFYTITSFGGDGSKAEGYWSLQSIGEWLALPLPTITYNQPANGTIIVKTIRGVEIPSGTKVPWDTQVLVSVQPNTGYSVQSANIDIGGTQHDVQSGTPYTICGNTTIDATMVEHTDYYLVGLDGDWSPKATNKFVDGKLNINIEGNGTKEFKIIKQQGNTQTWLSTKYTFKPTALTTTGITGDNENMKIETVHNGIYQFTWNNNGTLTVAYPDVCYLHGDFNSWTDHPNHALHNRDAKVFLEEGNTYEFKVAERGVYRTSTLYQTTITQKGTITMNDANAYDNPQDGDYHNCKIQANMSGFYIFHYDAETKNLTISFPLDVNDYRLAYKDDIHPFHPAGIYIKHCTSGEQLDTISFFIHHEETPRIILQQCLSVNGNSATWNTVNTYSVDDIATTGVFNFVLQQTNDPEHAAQLLTEDVHPYTGDYYIRTNAAPGKWVEFQQDGNKMTYSSYADNNEPFSHYFCKWVSTEAEAANNTKNVKYTIANDYSYCISDTLAADPEDANPRIVTNASGDLPTNSANVRFGWDWGTNQLTRAYMAGTTDATKETFLRIEHAVDLLNSSGTAVENINFEDLQNWIYQVDVRAKNTTTIKLTALYAEHLQYFKGDKDNSMRLLSSDAEEDEWFNMRLTYDFKTNHLIIAWLPDNAPIGGELDADMMVIREHNRTGVSVTQLNLNNALEKVKTVYAVMSFTQDWIKKNSREQSIYWVSFPFDVKLSEAFGFGEYADAWIMQYYDGDERAKKGLYANSGTYWKYIFDPETILKKGVGYVLVLDLNKVKFNHGVNSVSLYFPSNGEVGTITQAEEPNVTVEVPAHQCNLGVSTTGMDHNITDSHWNLIGVPAFKEIDQFNVTQYHYDQQDASFYYKFNTNLSKYTVISSTSVTFEAMYSYMVQFAGTINWTTKTVDGVTPPQLAARRNSENDEPEKVVLNVELLQGEEMADQTFVQLQQEGATADFDMNLDLTKIINSGANIYTLAGEQRIQSAGNALPMGEAIVPVGVQIATEGEYTFRMPDGTEGMVVELIDYETNTRTNLLLSDYIITLSAGSYENRFALHIQPQKDVVTGVGNVGDETKGIEKYLIDGKLIIRTAEGIFDAQGHRL